MTRSIRIATTAAFVFAFAIGAASAREESMAELKAQAKISEASARATALTKVPSGTIASAELEKEHGKLIWSFDINTPGTKNVTEIQVNAKTGKIVSTQVETPKKELKEAAQELKEKKK